MKRFGQIALFTALAAGGVVMVFPFLWMVCTGFKTLAESVSPDLSLLPQEWQWRNFTEVFASAPFTRYFFNTMLVAIAVTACVVVTSVMAGYAFAHVRFMGRSVLFAVVLATMMVPFEARLIPNYVLVHTLGWYNTYWALIVPWCANAFSVFMMRQAFMSLPMDYFDAAKIDGCGHFRFLAWIGAPLVRPTIVTVGLFAFLASYNALLWPLVATGEENMRVLQVGLAMFANAEGVRVNLLMCASTIVIVPTVALYFVAQRYFLESSLAAGIRR